MAKMTRISKQALEGELRVINVGYIPRKQQWMHRTFNTFAVGFVVRGEGEYRVEGGHVHAVRPGSQFTVFPGPTFHYGPTPPGNWEEYFVILQGRGVKGLLERQWFFTDGSVQRLLDLPPLVERFRELIRTFDRRNPGDADRAVLMAQRLLLEMYHSRASVRQAHEPTAALQAVFSHFHEHFAESIDLAALAERHAMSYSHLRQQVRKITGLPPHKYLLQLRCREAERLLAHGDLSVKQVAAQLGFDDAFTFSRTFKRTTGLSPLHYRHQAAPWSRG